MMNQYPNKYTKGPGGAVNPAAHAAAERVRNILLIVLLVALVAVGIVGGKAISFRSKCEPTYVSRMQMECEEALSSMNSLSRNGGYRAMAILGKIRSNIRAMEAINEVSSTVSGDGYLVEPKVFTNLYEIIDIYSSNTEQVGGDRESETNLRTALTELQGDLEKLAE